MRQVLLSEILTKKQIEEVKEYVYNQTEKGLKPFDTEFINGLKALLNQWEKDLLLKEVLPDYLAYVVAHIIHKKGGGK